MRSRHPNGITPVLSPEFDQSRSLGPLTGNDCVRLVVVGVQTRRWENTDSLRKHLWVGNSSFLVSVKDYPRARLGKSQD